MARWEGKRNGNGHTDLLTRPSYEAKDTNSATELLSFCVGPSSPAFPTLPIYNHSLTKLDNELAPSYSAQAEAPFSPKAQEEAVVLISYIIPAQPRTIIDRIGVSLVCFVLQIDIGIAFTFAFAGVAEWMEWRMQSMV